MYNLQSQSRQERSILEHYNCDFGRADGKVRASKTSSGYYSFHQAGVLLVIGGPAVEAKTTAPDKIGGQPIQPGESHRISKGDVIIVPPDRIHWHKNVEAPFRYLEVQTP